MGLYKENYTPFQGMNLSTLKIPRELCSIKAIYLQFIFNQFSNRNICSNMVIPSQPKRSREAK